MSAQFKNSKKKVSQAALRKFMNDHKAKVQVPLKKIESPLAKYDETGQLTCVLCRSVVRSEAVWTIHINSKQHKENIEAAKRLKEKTNNFTRPAKRELSPPPETQSKKLKSILKNSTARKDTSDILEESKIDIKIVEKSKGDIKILDKSNSIEAKNDLPSDFFDGVKTSIEETKMEVEEDAVLPEGFFDDPKLDAKARNKEYKDPIEEEWEKFQKEIRDANTESAAIIAEDQEEATTERQIEDIDEQLRNWSRVVSMEKKKLEIVSSKIKDTTEMEQDGSSSEVEEDFDEFLDWRSKKGF